MACFQARPARWRAAMASAALVAVVLCGGGAPAGAVSWTIGLRYAWLDWSMSDNGMLFNENWTWQGVNGAAWEGQADAVDISAAGVWGPELSVNLSRYWEARFALRMSQSRLALGHTAESNQSNMQAAWDYNVDVPVKRLELEAGARRRVGRSLAYSFGLRYQTMDTGAASFRSDLFMDGENVVRIERQFRAYSLTSIGAGAGVSAGFNLGTSGLFSYMSVMAYPLLLTSGEAENMNGDNAFSFSDIDNELSHGGSADWGLGYAFSASLTAVCGVRADYYTGAAGGGDEFLWNAHLGLGLRP